VYLAGPAGRRSIDLGSFFTSYRRTALGAGELLTTIEIPRPWPGLVRFYKVSKRRFDDISTVAAAIGLDRDGAGRVQRARVALGGVAATPLIAREAEHAVVGQIWNEAAVERMQEVLDRTLNPISDARGSREYRLEVAKSLIAKFYWETAS
jgi:xanthine dehydrogenase small subunit